MASNAKNAASRTPHFTRNPVLQANPNPGVPLAALLHLVTDAPVRVTLSLDDGENAVELAYERSEDLERTLPVLGMRPNRRYTAVVSVHTTEGLSATYPQLLVYTTPPLPAGVGAFPALRTSISLPELMEPGITLLSIRRRRANDRPFNEGYGLLVGVDSAGEVIWYYQTDTRISQCIRLQNGNLVYLTHDHRLVEIDMLGNTFNVWYAARHPQGPVPGIPVDALTFHHAVEVLPWGNFLVLSTVLRYINNYYTSETSMHAPRQTQAVMGDEVVEFTRDGAVVWRWNTFEQLDPFRIGYDTFVDYWPARGFPGAHDWTHGNGLCYDASDDAILVSLRLQEAIIKVDRKSRTIKWILGPPDGWPDLLAMLRLQADDNLTWFWHQHAPMLTRQNTLLLFDNGNHRAIPFNKKTSPDEISSRAVEYAIDEEQRTVHQVWVSESNGPGGELALVMGDADELPQTGNVLVCYGGYAKSPDSPSVSCVREWSRTHPAQLVWEVFIEDTTEDDTIGWAVFSGIRLPDLLA